ncbi:MAG: trigger factor [Candidatus Sericytochromatia bacterium]|nr:trigger factor [Candidatus Sericytochromatia bacterium]
MKVTLEKKEKNQVHLEVEVDLDRVKKALEHAYRQASQRVNIPGFRKGKAPRQLVERTVGADYIKSTALEKLIPEALEEAVQKESLEIIERPNVEVVEFETDKALVFKAQVPVRPEVEFKGAYTDLAAQAPKIELDPAAVEAKIAELQSQKATYVAADKAIEQGDVAMIDFKGRLKDAEEPFEGGTAENFRAEIAPGRFIDGFMENLIGKKAGESTAFDVTFPEQYHAENLAGQPATFEVTVREVQARTLPQLDDAFAATCGDFNTVDDLRAHVTKELTEEAEEGRDNLLRQQVLDQVLELSDVEIPEVMINREIEFLMRQYLQVMQAQGMNVNQMFTQDRLGKWREELREEATKRIRTSLTLGTVAKAEGLTVTQEEVDEEITQYAAMYRVDPTAVRNQLIQSGGWTTLADEVLSNKILDWLLEKAKVSEGPIPARYAPKPEGEETEAATEAPAAELAPAKKNTRKKKSAESAEDAAAETVEA